ncbi:winged helix-turn-helix domain-containing protein [Alcaligenes faecalis]|uniref:winged helix-turn-helix domain-containing protein n=1 Tax=Alcaligenes faecalis TaxID=511 RepID=UPI00203F741D
MRTERIVLLFDNGDLIQKLIDDLALWGIPVQVLQAHSAVSFTQDEQAEAGELIMMHSPNEDLLSDVGRLRAQSAAMGLVVLRFEGTLTPEHGSLLLLAGADICFDERTHSMEVLASIQALRRRELALRAKYADGKDKAFPAAPAEIRLNGETREPLFGWDLLEDGWRLMTPQRHAITLTGAERRVLRVLLAESPEPVAREKLFSDKEGDQPPSRYIDVVISRLKRKVAQHGERLPIRSVWGVGYVFSAH